MLNESLIQMEVILALSAGLLALLANLQRLLTFISDILTPSKPFVVMISSELLDQSGDDLNDYHTTITRTEIQQLKESTNVVLYVSSKKSIPYFVHRRVVTSHTVHYKDVVFASAMYKRLLLKLQRLEKQTN